MDEELKKVSEDDFADVDFNEDDPDSELKSAEFVDFVPKKIELKETKEEKSSQFYGENDKILAEKIIDKKTGRITEIKYGNMGNKVSVMIRDKDKVLRKAIDYYENGAQKLSTEYGRDRSYKSMMYNIDGSWLSYVEKHADGTADATYFDADGKGTKLIVKMDANKQVIEKRIER